MVKFVSNPPDAAALMMSARSFGDYDLAGSLADLIDNSISAKAKKIDIRCLYNDGVPIVKVVDNGEGMSADVLKAAMRPASRNPTEERSPDDLGRFGWGMKSASFSQCKCLTVISRQNGITAGAVWDLEDLDQWKMGILSDDEIESQNSDLLPKNHGTEILWTNCDRLSEFGTIKPEAFNDLVAHTGNQLALVFHKFISGEAGRGKLKIKLNGLDLEPYDPFYRHHDATQGLELEVLPVDGTMVQIQPYILPHFSKLKPQEHERLGGEEGFLRNQGFYVYRNHRLIIHGTWFRLAKFGELSQLVRISIDIPNSIDDIWKITVDKSDAQLPAVLRKRLGQIVNGLKGKSARVFRGKGGKIDDPRVVSIWTRHSKNNEIRYTINRNHPVIAQLLEKEDANTARAAILLIEQNFPVASFSGDATVRPDDISQTVSSPGEFISTLDVIAPEILIQCGGDMGKMVEQLRKTEPFADNWPLTEEYLKEKGWL